VVIALSISFIYEDEVSEIFLEEVNKSLKSDFQTEEVNLSLLKKFPNATIVLNNATLTDLDTNKDTSLFISTENIFLQFDIVDIFNKDYSIDRVHARNCEVHYFLSKKEDITRTQNTDDEFELDVSELKINGLRYVIENRNTGLRLQGYSNETVLKGNFSSREFFMNVESQTKIKHFKANNFRYINNKSISIDSDIKVTPDFYRIQHGLFSLEEIPFTIEGTLDRTKNHLDLTCTGKNLSISRLKLNVPWEVKKQMKNVTISSGRIDLLAEVRGPVKNKQPNIEADLKIRNGKFNFEVKDKIELSKVDASVYYTNGIFNQPRSASLTLNNIQANYKQSKIGGSFTIKNFREPELEAKINLDFKLDDIRKRIDSLGFNDVKGSVASTLNLSTPFEKLNELSTLIKEKRLTGDFTLDRVSFNVGNLRVKHLKGFAYIDRYLYCDNLHFQLNETSDITFTGKLKNYYQRHSEDLISIQGKINSENMRMNKLIGRNKQQKHSFKLPDSVSADLDVLIENLYYKNQYFRDITGSVVLQPKLLRLKSLDFNALNGSCKLDGTLKSTSDNKFYLNSRIFLENVDIQEGFKSFNNFGQTYIKANNIKGSLDGEFYLKASMDSALSIEPTSLYNVSNFTIHKGELIQFKPLLELSRFISVSELKHVRFSEFSNRITIENETIEIPKMDINSSAMDLTISGFHKFNGEYKYNMNLLLSEILSRKAKPKVQKYGYIEEDGVGDTRLYLLMRGDTASSTIKYDKKGVKAKIRKDIKEEKKDLKRLFNDEFGLFGKDSLSKSNRSEGTGTNKFKIDWEEKKDSLRDNNKSKPKDKKKKDSKFIIEWDKDTISGL
jgi:hypothetical protein